jgi:hypothetical protein
MPDTATILSVTNSSDGQGGYTQVLGTVTASQACRIDPLRGDENLSGGAVQPFHRFVVTMAYDASLTVSNLVRIDGTTYAVKSIDSDKSWPVTLRAYVERV